MKYLIKVNTESEVQQALNNDVLGKPYLALIESENRIDWNSKEKEKPFSERYLTFKITSNGNITWKAEKTGNTKTVYYSKDNGGTWTQFTVTTSSTSITVVSGDTVLFKATTNSAYGDILGKTIRIKGSAKFELEGNIMSLIYGDNFKNQTTIPATYFFYSLFKENTGLTSAENLILPATTLKTGCYYQMFGNCTSLTTAPSILPATTLAESCYCQMFYNCKSLVTAPELPATTLVKKCYLDMFRTANNLKFVKCLATDKSATDCTTSWLYKVASTGTFVKKAGVTWSRGESGIPNNWTIVDA